MTKKGDRGGARDAHDARAAVRDVSHAIDRTTARAQKLAKGTYGPADAASDAGWWTALAWDWGLAFVTCAQDLYRGPARKVPPLPIVGHPAEVRLLAPSKGPITLQASGFRAIGWPREFDLGPDAAVFTPNPPILAAGIDSCTVTVIAPPVPAEARNHTIIYEGVIRDATSGAVVTDVIRIFKPAHVP